MQKKKMHCSSFQIEVILVPNSELSVLRGGKKCLLLWGWPYGGICSRLICSVLSSFLLQNSIPYVAAAKADL